MQNIHVHHYTPLNALVDGWLYTAWYIYICIADYYAIAKYCNDVNYIFTICILATMHDIQPSTVVSNQLPSGSVF